MCKYKYKKYKNKKLKLTVSENYKDNNNRREYGAGGKWRLKSIETEKSWKLRATTLWSWSNQNNIKGTCVFRTLCLVLLCVHTYFIGSQQSEAGAYSITKASEHGPTWMLDNTRACTQSSSIVPTLGKSVTSPGPACALRWKRSYRESEKALNCLSKEWEADGERKPWDCFHQRDDNTKDKSPRRALTYCFWSPSASCLSHLWANMSHNRTRSCSA